MSAAALEVTGLHKSFDGVKPLDGFSCRVERGEIVGLVGPNGAGKTTLFNVLTGFLAADSGCALCAGRTLTGLPPYKVTRLGIARTFQDLRLIRQMGVLDNVMLAFQDQHGENVLSALLRPSTWRKADLRNHDTALALLDSVGLSEKTDDLAENLSYGQQKLLSLMCCLATGANLLLFDEPVAGIAPEMIERVISVIKALPGRGKTVVLIEHNMEAVAEVCDRVIFMDAGRNLAEGTPDEVRNDPRVIEAYID
jgi:ABC-type branched-subunit amino acid transport system ATPase component